MRAFGINVVYSTYILTTPQMLRTSVVPEYAKYIFMLENMQHGTTKLVLEFEEFLYVEELKR